MTQNELDPIEEDLEHRKPTVLDKVMILGTAGLAIGGMVMMCIVVLLIIWLR